MHVLHLNKITTAEQKGRPKHLKRVIIQIKNDKILCCLGEFAYFSANESLISYAFSNMRSKPSKYGSHGNLAGQVTGGMRLAW